MKVRAGSTKIEPKLVQLINFQLDSSRKKKQREREPKLIKSEMKVEKLQPMPQKYNG